MRCVEAREVEPPDQREDDGLSHHVPGLDRESNNRATVTALGRARPPVMLALR